MPLDVDTVVIVVDILSNNTCPRISSLFVVKTGAYRWSIVENRALSDVFALGSVETEIVKMLIGD